MTGRAPMRSPGRPGVSRDVQRLFWARVAEGLTSEDAAVACGVSPAVGTRWFRESGGMPQISLTVSGRYLSFAEREDIAVMRAQDVGVREIARRLGRSASTISREGLRVLLERKHPISDSGTPELSRVGTPP